MHPEYRFGDFPGTRVCGWRAPEARRQGRSPVRRVQPRNPARTPPAGLRRRQACAGVFGWSPGRLRLWAAPAVLAAMLATAPSTAVADWGRAPQVVIALLPNGTSPRAFDSLPRIAPGLLNAGIGDVPDEQTYLDIGQGNRVEEHLYDAPLPPSDPHGTRAPRWAAIVARADAPPADLIPGLLVSTLRAARLPTVADGQLREAALLAAARNGGILRSNVGASLARCPAAACVLDVKPADLGPLLASLRGADLLIALERPPPQPDHQLTIG